MNYIKIINDHRSAAEHPECGAGKIYTAKAECIEKYADADTKHIPDIIEYLSNVEFEMKNVPV